MRSKKVTLSIPFEYWDAMQEHAIECGYRNAREMLTWMPLYSMNVGKPHVATAPIAALPEAAQDAIIAAVVKSWRAKDFGHSSYFGRLLADVVRELGVPVTPEIVAKVLADAFRSVSREEREAEANGAQPPTPPVAGE